VTRERMKRGNEDKENERQEEINRASNK